MGTYFTCRNTHVPAHRCAERTKHASHCVKPLDCNEFVQNVFRLLLATVPGEFSSLISQCATLQLCRWLSSNKAAMSHDLMVEIGNMHPCIPIVLSNPGIKLLPSRVALPSQEHLLKTRFYRIFMEPYNWRHAVSLFFWKSISPPELDCFFSIYRTAAQCDFSDTEIAELTGLYPEIERARLRVIKLEEQRAALRSLQYFVRDLPVPAVLLNWRLEVLYENRLGVDYCAWWRSGESARLMKSGPDLPPELQDACQQMKSEWRKQVAPHGLMTRTKRKRVVTCPICDRLRATVSMLQDSSLLGDPNFLIVFEGRPARIGSFCASPTRMTDKLTKLTARERDVVLLVTEGISNQEIADRLGRCVGTVKAELHAAYKKLRVVSRAQLALTLVSDLM